MLELLLPPSPPPQQIAQFYPAPTTTTVYTSYPTPTAPTVYVSPSYRSNYPNYPTSYPTYYRTYPQTTVIIQTTPIYYPPAVQSRCSTSIVGSPIPSAVPLDRLTGQPCR